LVRVADEKDGLEERLMRRAILIGLGVLAGGAVSPACAQPTQTAAQEQVDAADQVVGLFGATCLHFAGDTTGLRGFLQQQKAPLMPQAAREAFLAGRQGEVYDVSYKTVKLALVSMADGGCEAVAEQADPQEVTAVLEQQAKSNSVPLTPLGSQATPKGRPGVQQTAYGLNLDGHIMHILVSTAAAPPQAVLTLVPK
jgi:hypothetical protein